LGCSSGKKEGEYSSKKSELQQPVEWYKENTNQNNGSKIWRNIDRKEDWEVSGGKSEIIQILIN